MLPLSALGALTTASIGLYVKIGMAELKLIQEMEKQRRKRSNRK